MMLVAPTKPMPHVIEKILMLKNGTLHRPIDILDLFYHLLPLILLILKVVKNSGSTTSNSPQPLCIHPFPMIVFYCGISLCWYWDLFGASSIGTTILSMLLNLYYLCLIQMILMALVVVNSMALKHDI